MKKDDEDIPVEMRYRTDDAREDDPSCLRETFKMRRIERTEPQYLVLEVKRLISMFDELPRAASAGLSLLKTQIEELRQLVQLHEAHLGIVVLLTPITPNYRGEK